VRYGNAETDVAAQGAATEARARISGADENQGGASGPQGQAAEGATPPDRVKGINVWLVARRPRARDVMRRKYRLRANTDFARLRREGRTQVHPLLVLSVLPSDVEHSRFGFAVGRRIGKAVIRNRVKRRMRESVRMRLRKHEIAAGWDVVFIARHPIRDASFHQVDEAIGLVLRRAGLLREAS
jgi:ribonuclease P protein component